jgi:hypothetical protein
MQQWPLPCQLMEQRGGALWCSGTAGLKILYTALTALNIEPLCFQTVALSKKCF